MENVANRCACHSVNLYDIQIAVCCPVAINIFGSIQNLFVFFSPSTQRWQILNKNMTQTASNLFHYYTFVIIVSNSVCVNGMAGLLLRNFFQLRYYLWAPKAKGPRVSDPPDPPLLSTGFR